jgi:hypothetical protein
LNVVIATWWLAAGMLNGRGDVVGLGLETLDARTIFATVVSQMPQLPSHRHVSGDAGKGLGV